jgi:hypothetical protein
MLTGHGMVLWYGVVWYGVLTVDLRPCVDCVRQPSAIPRSNANHRVMCGESLFGECAYFISLSPSLLHLTLKRSICVIDLLMLGMCVQDLSSRFFAGAQFEIPFRISTSR